MCKNARLLAALCSLALCLPGVASGTNDAPPEVTLRKKPSIISQSQPRVTSQEATRIKQLIHNLAEIDHPDSGFSATFSGYTFSPVSGSGHFDGGLLSPGNAKTSSDLVELVKFGPKALPFLLETLKDRTATKLEMKLPISAMGGMWFDIELQCNPANANERKVIEARPRMDALASNFDKAHVSSYTETVGDICLVIIGQIVNRPYEASRYQMTACVVLNSPTHDPILAEEVRELWSATNPAQHLLDSLITDFVTEKIDYSGRHYVPSRWMSARELQSGAAMRLLYYFPKETTNMVVLRLRELEVSNGVRNKRNANRVSPVQFIDAVAWSAEPAVRAEVRRIFEVTTDPEILTAAIVATDPSDVAARTRLEEFISLLRETEAGPFGKGYNLLVALGRHFGPEARAAFERYMTGASLQRRRSMCRVLARVHGDWSVDLLGPLLSDTRPAEGWTYAVIPDQNEPRLPIRICDEAADTIAKNFPRLVFKMAGNHTDLDRQIQKMRDQIAGHNY